MNRETWIPIAGLVGLFVAGTVMLYATSGPPAPPAGEAPAADRSGANQAQAGAQKVDPQQLTFKRPIGDRAQAPEGSKNLVMVVLSAARKDQLQPYGGAEEVTPWIGELAASGVRFDDAVANGGWSRPAVLSLTTGEHALALNLVDDTQKTTPQKLPPGVQTLAERLAAQGYYTMGVNALPHAGRSAGLAQGFDHYRDAHPQGYTPKNRLTAEQAVTIAGRMLGARKPEEKARPFFLELNLVDLHKPIKVPPAEFEPFEGPDHQIAPYRAVLHRVDEALAKLDDQLEKQGLADDTYVVVVGAIGEGLNMPEHHGHAHGRNLYPSTAEIPWIVRGPEVPSGKVVEGLAAQVDVTPTLLGLLGLPAEAGVGRDWSARVREGGRTDRAETLVDTWYYAANRAAIYTPDKACLKDFGSANLAEEGWRDACYDRAADPEFSQPVDAPALMARLEAWRSEAPGSRLKKGPRQAGEKVRGPRPGPQAAGNRAVVKPEAGKAPQLPKGPGKPKAAEQGAGAE